MRPLTFRLPVLAAGLLALLLASCASDDRPRRGAPPTPPKPVAGESTYFGGQLAVTVRVAMEFQRPGGDEAGAGGGREGGGRRGGDGGNMSFGGGMGPAHFGGGGGGGPGGGRGGPGGRGDGPPMEGGGGGARPMATAGGVPMMIHVRLRNTSAAPVEVMATDFVSPLGNFVVQPDKLAVPANGEAEFSPMTSFVRGDLPDEMPVTLVLRVAGKSEKQILILRPVAPTDLPPNGPGPESRPTDK